jgi:DnaJ homolog subfamily A member 5
VYQEVFQTIVSCERRQSDTTVERPTTFGDADSEWGIVRDFYQSWESFSSALNFAWEDQYNVHEDAPNRTVRRLMEDENRKARKSAKKEYNGDILQLVAFVKRRDPRVKAKAAEWEQQKREQAAQQKHEMVERKKEQQRAKEEWRENALREMELAEEEDRLAGRIRLADLEDDYVYGVGVGGKKSKGKKKRNRKSADEEQGREQEHDNTEEVVSGDVTNEVPNHEEVGKEGHTMATEAISDESPNEDHATWKDEDDAPVFSSSEDEEPDIWRCECCRKDFKSEGQMENHMKSKKHKESFKKYQAML